MSLKIHVDETADALSKRIGLKAAELSKILMYWARKAPPGTFEDAVQEMAIAWLEQRPEKGNIAFYMGRHIISERWKRVYTKQRKDAASLDEVLDDTSGLTLRDLLVDSTNYEVQVMGHESPENLMAMLPAKIAELVQKRLNGEKVVGWNARYLNQWAAQNAGRIQAVLA